MVPLVLEELWSRVHYIPGLRHQQKERASWCVPASLAMIAERYGTILKQEWIATQGETTDDGTMPRAIPRLIEQTGFHPHIYQPPKMSDALRHLERDEPVLAIFGQRSSAVSGGPNHAVVLGGYAGHEAIIVYDPDHTQPTLAYLGTDRQVREHCLPTDITLHVLIGVTR